MESLTPIDNILDGLDPVWIECFNCELRLDIMSKAARAGTTEEGFLIFRCPKCGIDLTQNVKNIIGQQRYFDLSMMCLWTAYDGLKGGNT